MTIDEVVRLLFERSNAVQSFWGYYATIAIGLVAISGAAPPSRRLAVVLSIAFVVFAFFNGGGIVGVSKQRLALFKLLKESSAEFGPVPASVVAIRDASTPPPVAGVVVFHIIADIGVLTAIWVLATRAIRCP